MVSFLPPAYARDSITAKVYAVSLMLVLIG
jgi:hypothetical protein